VADQPKRLQRDPDNKMIAGIASGVAEYFNIDPTIVRVLWALTVFFGGFGAVVYLIMWIVVPEAEPAAATPQPIPDSTPEPAATPPVATTEPASDQATTSGPEATPEPSDDDAER